MDDSRYKASQLKKYMEHEALCKRCGACCGIFDGDPCEHLKTHDKKTYYCEIYDKRFGLHKTLSGEPILCVPIRNMLHRTWWGRNNCAYVKILENNSL